MPIGKKVLVVGGGLHGCEMAEFLVKSGRQVTMITNDDTLMDSRVTMVLNNRLFAWLTNKGVTMLTGVKYEMIHDKGMTVITADGEKKEFLVDTVIPVSPLAPNQELAESIRGKVPEVYTIGDCAQDGLIVDAIADGYRVGRSL
jgi:2,4-dienoyl-CoA reductase (NADPH2)